MVVGSAARRRTGGVMSDVAVASTDTEYGRRIAPGYRVLGVVQRGRDFVTYDAWSEQRYSRCVVKAVLPTRLGRDNTSRLLHEGELLTRLDHPHLVRGYEIRRRPRALVVMETLTGSTVRHMIESGIRFPPGDIAHLGSQLTSALRFLHTVGGVLHLDLKPGNVIVGGGRARLIDLSLAQPPGPVTAGLGTRDYLSPEQGVGGVVSAASDVWGLGVTLYEAATGVSPFERSDAADSSTGEPCRTCGRPTKYRQLSSRAPRVTRLRRLPSTLARLLDACLEPDPQQRPELRVLDQSFHDLAGTHRPEWA